jgi:hypothetical protein
MICYYYHIPVEKVLAGGMDKFHFYSQWLAWFKSETKGTDEVHDLFDYLK